MSVHKPKFKHIFKLLFFKSTVPVTHSSGNELLYTASSIDNGSSPGALPPMPELTLKYLCLAHRKHPDQAHLWMAARKRKWTHPLQSLVKARKVCNNLTLFTLPPHLALFALQKKLASKPTLDGSLGAPPSQCADFPNKVTITSPNNSSFDLLACHMTRRLPWWLNG